MVAFRGRRAGGGGQRGGGRGAGEETLPTGLGGRLQRQHCFIEINSSPSDRHSYPEPLANQPREFVCVCVRDG